MIDIFTSTPLFGMVLSLLMFEFGKYIFVKTKISLFNPLLIAGIGIISILSIFNISVENYNKGSGIIEFFLAPATISLVIPLVRQIDKLKQHYLPILIGAIVGSIVAMLSIYVLGKILEIDYKLVISFIPKSITTPFGIEASKMIGGIPSITVFGIVITGITGNMLAIVIFKIIGDVHPVAKGVGIGVASHAVGTSKAIEIGEVEGAMSALSIIIAGLITIILLQVFKFLL